MYKLSDSVDLNEAFFGSNHTGKHGHGKENKTQVAVVLKFADNGCPLYLKMQVIPDAKNETLLQLAKVNIKEGSTIHSDAFRSYNSLSEKYNTNMRNYIPSDDTDRFQWLQVMISKIKSNIESAYSGSLVKTKI